MIADEELKERLRAVKEALQNSIEQRTEDKVESGRLLFAADKQLADILVKLDADSHF